MNIDIVKDRVIAQGYTPLFTEYKTNKDKLLIETKEGYLGYVTNNGLNRGDKISPFRHSNPYTIHNIERFIINNDLGCKLLSEKWVSHKEPLLLRCPECHQEYTRTWGALKRTANELCNDCGIKKSAREYRVDIEIVRKDLRDRGYKPLFDKYISNNIKILVQDDFGYLGEVTYKQILQGSGFRKFHTNNKYTIENIRFFIEENKLPCKLLTNDYKGNLDLMDFECECGNEYTTSLTSLLRFVAIRCDRCTKKQSSLEFEVEQWLITNNINYKTQYRYDDCRSTYPLPFDFRIKTRDNDFVIEVNGIQHYEPVEFFGGEDAYRYRVSNDNIKIEYCIDNNIDYIELSYIDISNNNYKKILINRLQP